MKDLPEVQTVIPGPMAKGEIGLREWERAIQRELEVAESACGAIADQTANYRMEFRELLLVLGLLRH